MIYIYYRFIQIAACDLLLKHRAMYFSKTDDKKYNNTTMLNDGLEVEILDLATKCFVVQKGVGKML